MERKIQSFFVDRSVECRGRLPMRKCWSFYGQRNLRKSKQERINSKVFMWEM